MVPTSGRNREETRTDANSNFLNAEDAESQKAAEEKNRTRFHGFKESGRRYSRDPRHPDTQIPK